MLVIGAGGFAKEVLEVLLQNKQLMGLSFYDDVNEFTEDSVFGYPLIKSLTVAKSFFEDVNPKFTIGIGNPNLRMKMYKKFTEIGGEFISVVSPKAEIGLYKTFIGKGCNILPNAIVSSGTNVGKGCILYYNVVVAHDCEVGNFVELSPGATLLGKVKVGDYSHIGANATILPNITIGSNVVIGAGAVVTENLPNNCVAVGVPAKIIKKYK